MHAGLLHGLAAGDGVTGGQGVHEGGVDTAVDQVFHGQRAGFIEAQFEGVALFLLFLLDGFSLGGAALHAQLDGLGQDVGRGQLGVGRHQEHAGDFPVRIGKVHHLAAFLGDAHAGGDHVDLLVGKGQHDAVPGHGLVDDLEAHGLGDPVHGIDIEAGGLAGLFIDIGKRRIVGVDTVDVGLLGKGRHGGQQAEQQGANKKFFHGASLVKCEGRV